MMLRFQCLQAALSHVFRVLFLIKVNYLSLVIWQVLDLVALLMKLFFYWVCIPCTVVIHITDKFCKILYLSFIDPNVLSYFTVILDKLWV